MTPTRRQTLAAGATTIATAISGCITAAREQTEPTVDTYEGIDALRIDVDAGDVAVTAEDREDVRVEATKEIAGENDRDTIELRTEQTDGTLELSVERTDVLIRLGPEPLLHLDVAVPEGTTVEAIDTDSGAATLDGVSVTDDITLDTASGDVDFTDVTVEGGLELNTASGEIRLEASTIQGPTEFDTASGDVIARRTTFDDDLEANTASGELQIEESTIGGATTIDTASGDATLATLSGPAEIETASGDVDLIVPADFDADLSVSTAGGDISVEGVSGTTTRTETELSTTLGDGGPEVTIDAASGDVRIRGEEQ